MHWANCNSHTDSHLNCGSSLNLLVCLLLSSGLLSFAIFIVLMAWVDISRNVCERLGHKWDNAGYICCGLYYCLTCLCWLPVDWCHRVHHVSWEFSTASLYISTPCFLWPRIDCLYYVFISKQLSDIFWIPPTMIWRDTVINHTSERILVTRKLFALYALFVIHLLTYAWTYVFIRTYDLMTLYIYWRTWVFI